MRKILLVLDPGMAVPALVGDYEITVCQSAAEAAALLPDGFDGLVLNLFLPGTDAIALLEQTQDHLPPVVLLLAHIVTPYILQASSSLGVGHILRFPWSDQNISDRLRDMFLKFDSPLPNVSLSDARYHLKRLGISSGKGCRRILTILKDYDPDLDPCLFNDFYPDLAREEGVTMAAIDNSIHRTIKQAYESGNATIWRSCFPDSSGCPKNKDFLSTLAQLLKTRGSNALR